MKYDKIFLIGNPVAGVGALKKIEKAINILRQRGIPFEIFLTKKRGDAETFAREIKESYNDKILVIGCGGDGTYNEIVNGLVYSSVPFAILPMGTTSVLAKELDIPSQIDKAIDIALRGKVERVHLGKIKNREKQKFFILMAGVGFDGSVVYNVNLETKRRLKKIAYIISGIKTLLNYQPDELEIQNEKSRKAYTVIVSNASCYGGRFKIAPDTDLRSPFLSVFLSKSVSKSSLVLQILGVILGKHLKMKNTEYFHTESLKIFGKAHVQIDGDYFGETPVEIEIVRNALNLVFPE